MVLLYHVSSLLYILLTLASATTSDGDLFAWARQHGSKIAEGSIEIKATSYGGRGLFAKTNIPANMELIRIPNKLQLGVRQLAEVDTDNEMQKMARDLPWEYILKNELFFIPLSIALIAEKRKGAASIFEPFLRELPQYCSNAVAAAAVDADDDLSDVEIWAPSVARKIQERRSGIQSLHEHLAPPSLSLEELKWAAANVCSRSLVRKRSPELTADQVQRIGEFSASDRSRMLPVIDLVNHGSLQHANVWVASSSSSDSDANNESSTSLKATRNIVAGEELLFDYGGGGGEKISNDRLLLDYGFVLPDHTDRVTMSLEEFDMAISALYTDRLGMKEVSEEDITGLEALIAFLIRHASGLQAGDPLLFAAGGDPSVQTLAVAVAMTCRGQEDVTRVLTPVRQSPKDASLLLIQIVESCTKSQIEFARYALKRASAMALIQKSSIASRSSSSSNDEECVVAGGEASSFANVAREYSTMCRAMLQKVADISR